MSGVSRATQYIQGNWLNSNMKPDPVFNKKYPIPARAQSLPGTSNNVAGRPQSLQAK